jgi:hypothetical protein
MAVLCTYTMTLWSRLLRKKGREHMYVCTWHMCPSNPNILTASGLGLQDPAAQHASDFGCALEVSVAGTSAHSAVGVKHILGAVPCLCHVVRQLAAVARQRTCRAMCGAGV